MNVCVVYIVNCGTQYKMNKYYTTADENSCLVWKRKWEKVFYYQSSASKVLLWTLSKLRNKFFIFSFVLSIYIMKKTKFFSHFHSFNEKIQCLSLIFFQFLYCCWKSDCCSKIIETIFFVWIITQFLYVYVCIRRFIFHCSQSA